MTSMKPFSICLFSFLFMATGYVLADNHLHLGEVDGVIPAPQVAGETTFQVVPAEEIVKKEKKEIKNTIPLKNQKKYRRSKGVRYPRCSECE